MYVFFVFWTHETPPHNPPPYPDFRHDRPDHLQKQYFDENGNQQADTATRDNKSYFGRSHKDWRAWHAYLEDNVEFPSYFRITKSDEAAVDHNRRVEDGWSQAIVFKNGDLSTTVIKD
jgi:hypothetical protein